MATRYREPCGSGPKRSNWTDLRHCTLGCRRLGLTDHDVRRRLLTAAEEEQRHRDDLDRRPDRIRGRVAVHVGGLAEDRLDDDAAGVALQRVERHHRGSML